MTPHLQNALQHELDRWQIFAPCAGTNVTIIDAFQGIWNGASGYANVDAMTPMPTGASCYIYSLTKTFIAVTILLLTEQQRIKLDDPISAYLSGVRLPETVTIRHLLDHTGGVPSYTELPAYQPATRERPSAPWSYEHLIATTCHGKPDFLPGERWHYSNTGYMLLRRLIEVVTQKTLADAVWQSIVHPLGLSRTYVATEVDDGQVTPGYCAYLNDRNTMEDIVGRYHPDWCLTGLIVSTTEEVAIFYKALSEERLVNSESLGKMTTWISCNHGGSARHAAPAFFRDPGYGLGLMIDPQWEHGGLYGHGGDGPGFNAWSMVLPDFHGGLLTLAIICNTSMSGHPFQLANNLIRTFEKTD